MTNKMGQWVDDLLDSVNEFITLETTDGIQREGKISGFEMRHMMFNNVGVDIPIEIELNGDPNDRVSLASVAKINIG